MTNGSLERTFKLFGLDRDKIADKIKSVKFDDGIRIEFTEEFFDGTVTVFSKDGDEIKFHHASEQLSEVFSDAVYCDKDNTLAECLVSLLREQGKMISVAESVTGGLIASKIVAVPCASDVFFEGLVTYNSAAKVKRLYVSSSLIKEKTAVCDDVCRAMVLGLLQNKDIDFALATTGYAMHENTENAGKVYIGASAQDKNISVKEYHFKGGRNYVRECAANAAIFQLLGLLV